MSLPPPSQPPWLRSWVVKKATLLVFGLGLLVTLRAPGQTPIAGQITDSLRAPLPGVSVYLSNRSDGAGLVYTMSDATGHYQLSYPPDAPDTLLLNARLLGFRPLSHRVVRNNRTRIELNLTLLEAPTRLNEVVVRAPKQRGIRYNDTTTYEAKQYVTGTERNLEDVLKKVPGFAVSPEGQISYKGNPVSGVYVEGDNLTGTNYQRLSRNLDATLVEKIQPVEHFVENKLLGGLVRSETTVLNITIPADRKRPLFGSVAADGALPHYRNATVNLFSYRKRSKLFFIGTHNNVGITKDPIAESLTSPAGTSLRAEVLPVRRLLTAPPLASGDFQRDLSTLNNETAVGLIHVLKPDSGHWKLLTDLTAYTNQQHQNRRTDTRYLLGDVDFLRLGELDQARQTTASLRMRNNFFATLSKKSNFTYENRLSLLRSDFRDTLGLTTEVPQATRLETIRQVVENRPVQFGQNAVLTNRFSGTSALQTQLIHTYDYLPGQLNIVSNSPFRQAAYLGQPIGDLLRQTARTSQHALNAETEYFRTARWLNYSALVGLEYTTTSIATGLAPVAATDGPGPTSYANQLTTRRSRVYGLAKFDKTLGRLNLSGAFGVAGLRFAIQDSGRTARQFGYPTGRLDARYTLSQNAFVEIGYGFDQSFSAPQELLRQPVLVDFRSFTRSAAGVVAQPEHRLHARFNLHNFATLTEVQAWVQASRRASAFGQRLQLDELLSRATLFVGPATQSATAQLMAAQFISPLSTRVQVESSGSYGESYNQINNNGQRLNRLLLFRNRLQLGTSFNIPINLFVGGTLTTSILTSQASNGETSTGRNNRFQADWQLILRLPHLTTTLRADQLFVNQNNYLFLGADATYVPAKGRFTYFLTLKNLLGTRSFAEVNFTNLVTTTTSYELLPRLIMPGASYRF